jgi:general secretion pathway protein K
MCEPMRSRSLRPLRCRRQERGIALVLVLWLTVLLTIIASSFAFSMRSEVLSARNAVSLAQARAAADGAVERTVFELMRPRVTAAWTANGAPHAWNEGEVSIVANIVDEAARIDLNTAPDPLLKNVFMSAGGLDDAAASQMVDVIGDWRDADDLKRPNGAEEADYRAAGLPYGPTNGPFETVGELSRVLGMTPEIYARVAPLLTVWSRQTGINPLTASRDVLLVLPNATPDVVDQYIAQRTAAIRDQLPPPTFPPAQAFGGPAIPVWRVHAEATLPDGVTFVREAVVRIGAEADRRIIVLVWSEGMPMKWPDANPQPQASASFTWTPSHDARRT